MLDIHVCIVSSLFPQRKLLLHLSFFLSSFFSYIRCTATAFVKVMKLLVCPFYFLPLFHTYFLCSVGRSSFFSHQFRKVVRKLDSFRCMDHSLIQPHNFNRNCWHRMSHWIVIVLCRLCKIFFFFQIVGNVLFSLVFKFLAPATTWNNLVINTAVYWLVCDYNYSECQTIDHLISLSLSFECRVERIHWCEWAVMHRGPIRYPMRLIADGTCCVQEYDAYAIPSILHSFAIIFPFLSRLKSAKMLERKHRLKSTQPYKWYAESVNLQFNYLL